jgi:asparagine synthase (glutamine-hydrolysing)
MCGIAAVISLSDSPVPDLERRLDIMNHLQRHRGPDGEGIWVHPNRHLGLAHRRLSIIDLHKGAQPMLDGRGNSISFNGEIYNFLELRDQLGCENFATQSDTEVILHAYRKWGPDCLDHLRGMFAFVLWDDANQALFCARDRFGIKPFYYAVVGDLLYIASETKALLPFLPGIETDVEGFKDYLAFQFCLAGKTLFRGIRELLPGHFLRAFNGSVHVQRYWEIYYHLDFEHTDRYFEDRIRELLTDSVRIHLRSDVPVGAYVSGGFDSSTVATLAAQDLPESLLGFTGKFSFDPAYDESRYARAVAQNASFLLHEIDITPEHFLEHIRSIIYHLDYPVAGPGSFPQFMLSRLASEHRKVVLGGQGGDEIFGGYVRYLIAYFEQCIKAAIDGTMHSGNFVVTYESIIPNLVLLRQYKPLLQEFWQEGLFEDLDRRYFRLINRTRSLKDEINWNVLTDYCPFETFREIFQADNVQKESYFDSMTHFDFKTLLPALLHVEDRVSMAHGLEARVPLLDHPLVEVAATIPSNIKFKHGATKHVLKNAMRSVLPGEVANREDKMGFPVPLTEWLQTELRDFVRDVLGSPHALQRELVDNRRVQANLGEESRYGRRIWGFLSLELWQQEFHDRESYFKNLLQRPIPSQTAGDSKRAHPSWPPSA